MKRKLLSVVTALVLCLGLLPGTAWAEEDGGLGPEVEYSLDGGSTWTPFEELVNLLYNAEGYFSAPNVQIKLQRDILYDAYTAIIVALPNQTVTIDGQGHTIKRGSQCPSQIFDVDQTNSCLTLKDITIDGGAVWDGEEPAARANTGLSGFGTAQLITLTNSQVILDAGTVLQNNDIHSSGSAAVVNAGGTLTMKAGSKILNNNSSLYSGGGVWVNGGSFVMEGGEISGNSAPASDSGGGGILVYNGSCTMSGGKISGNYAGSNGGGVTVQDTFQMTGGSIEENQTTLGGGGICILSGSAELSDGTIARNSITGRLGGGVLLNSGSLTVGGTLAVTDNTAADGAANNLYLQAGRTIATNGLTAGAQIGVSASAAPTESQPTPVTSTTDSCGYFSSDNPLYTVENHADGTVQLTRNPPCTVQFDTNGGGDAPADMTTNDQGKLDRLPEITREGYTWEGWFTEQSGGTQVTLDTVLATSSTAQTITLYAHWLQNFTVTFDSQGGSGAGEVLVTDGSKVSEPAAPVKSGYVFGGWYTEAGCETAWDFDRDTVTADTILYAKWTLNQHTVTFDSQGGSAVGPAQVTHGATVSAPAAPTRDGYAFGGWYTEAGCETAWNFGSDTVTADTTLYAKWTPNRHTVTFDSQGGSAVDSAEVHHGAAVSAPAAPTRDGYAFGGWYTEADCETAWDFASGTVAEDLTLYAKWWPVLPEPPAGEDGELLRLSLEPGIPQVPEGLLGIEELKTPEKLELAMKTEITQASPNIPQANTAVYDVALLVSTDGGATWTLASKDNFPSGGLTVTLPYPEGTHSGYRFTVVHMFTTTDFQRQPGDTEVFTPDKVKNTDKGLQVVLTGLSPISVGWVQPSTPTTPTIPIISSGGGGGGSRAVTYPITIENPEHGKVTSDRSSAPAGSLVTLTVTPDSGYTLDTLTVTGGPGNAIKPAAQGNGKYTFTMPGRAVTVKAAFLPLPDHTACDGGEDCPSRGFTDLGTAGTWYHEAVDYVLRKGLMSGYRSGIFGPNDTLSRAQLAQILYDKEGKPAVRGGNTFTDVASGAWYAPAVTWAAERGIVSGYGGGRFAPDSPITREQLAVMLWRYAGSPAAAGKVLRFRDADIAGSYAVDALCWAVENGIINGKGGGILDPQGLATRAQAAQMLMNFLEK